MSSVDDRIVNMQFNNKQFQTGAAESTKSLENLEKTIGGMGKGPGLTSMGNSVDGIKGKFSAMQIAGVTAIATIANKAVNAGLAFVKGFSIGPLIDGFHEYEKGLNSTQTILANTGLEGEKGLAKVGVVLQQLNDYSDLTIYNFGQMADSIGKFTAAGVGLKVSVNAIKGMANTAALSGASVEQLNVAMYQMSQALSTGVIKLMDWKSLQNASMGGENIQHALKLTNRTLGDNGKAMDAAIKSQGSFNASLSSGWLTAKTFTKTMKVMGGVFDKDLNKNIPYTVDQLKKMGFETGAAKQLNKLSGAAIDSATKVKTFSQLIGVVKESIGSGWATVFKDLFGNFSEATKLWTGVSDSITTTVAKIFKGVDAMLVGWKSLGGFQNLWTGFANIFKTLGNLIRPFIDAFKEVAPTTGKAGSGLAKLTKGFADVTGFVEKLSRGVSVITPYLIILFSTFKKLGEIGGAVVSGLSPILNLLGRLSGVVGNMTSKGSDIGGNLIAGLLQGLNPGAIQAAVTTFANNIVTWIKDTLGIHSPASTMVPVGVAIVQGVGDGIVKSTNVINSALAKIGKAIVDGMKQLFGGFDALDWATFMNAIFTGGLLLTLRSVAKSLKEFTGTLSDVTAPFKQLTGTLKTMQNGIRVKIVLDIAIAVALLTASLIALSFIKPEKIAVGLGALATMMGTLVGSLYLMNKIEPTKIVAMASAIFIISSAMLVLSGAIAILGNIDPEKLGWGLGAIAAGLGLMVLALELMSKGGVALGLPAAASAIFIMASAMTVLAAAVLAFGSMDWNTMMDGLAGVAIAMGIFTISLGLLGLVGPGVAAAGAGIYIAAAAMIVMAGAILALGSMKPKTLAQGLDAMADGLTMFTVALGILGLLGPLVTAAAVGIFIVSGAMLVMATAIGVIGKMSPETIAKGLGAIADGFKILLGAALAAIVLAPGLLVLGATVAALGLGLVLAGTGLLMAATAFSIFAVVGTAGIAVLVAGFAAFMALLPSLAVQLASAFVSFVQTIAIASPKLREAFGTIFESILGVVEDTIPRLGDVISQLIETILDIITDNIPNVGEQFQALIDTGLKILRDSIPNMVDTAREIVLRLIEGFAEDLPRIITAGTDIVVALIEGLGDGALEIATAAAETILDFVNGLTDAIELYDNQFRDAGLDLVWAIINGMTGGLLGEAVTAVTNAMKTLGGYAVDAFKSVFGISSPSKEAIFWGEMIVDGLVKGIKNNIRNAVGATIVLANAVISAGNTAVAKAQKDARKKQIAADAAAAKARISDKFATAAEKEAKKSPKNKKLEKAAEAARKTADKQEQEAQKAQERADVASQHVTDVKEFEQSDAQGKGDFLTDQASELADRATKMLARANAEAVAAKKLRGKEREAMLKQAREDAKAAKDLADRSQAAQEQANAYYAQSVNDRIKAMEAARAADEKAKADQALFDNATDAEKAHILEQRAIDAANRADAAQKQSNALIEQARALANTDAVQANLLLDQAEQLAQDAKDAADEAKQAQEQAKQYVVNGGSGTSFQLSRSAMEDAAKAIDRYTESLRQAEEAAQAATPVYQFVQNNNSPESLGDATIYRQTKNLLSAAEIKMGAPV